MPYQGTGCQQIALFAPRCAFGRRTLPIVSSKERRKTSELDDVERRVRAAADLAGITLDELAERIAAQSPDKGVRGWSARNIRSFNAEIPHNKREQVLRPIATACGLPYEFFTAPLGDLGKTGETGTQALADKINDLIATTSEGQIYFRGLVERLREERLEATRRLDGRIEHVETILTSNNAILENVQRLEYEWRSSRRSFTGAYVDLADNDAQDGPAEPESPDASDATQEEPPALGEGTG